MKPQGLHVLMGKIRQYIYILCKFLVKYPDGDLIKYKYPNRVYFYCKTKARLRVSGRQGKHAYAQESYLQDIISYISEKNTSFYDCKHKHSFT